MNKWVDLQPQMKTGELVVFVGTFFLWIISLQIHVTNSAREVVAGSVVVLEAHYEENVGSSNGLPGSHRAQKNVPHAGWSKMFLYSIFAYTGKWVVQQNVVNVIGMLCVSQFLESREISLMICWHRKMESVLFVAIQNVGLEMVASFPYLLTMTTLPERFVGFCVTTVIRGWRPLIKEIGIERPLSIWDGSLLRDSYTGNPQ